MRVWQYPRTLKSTAAPRCSPARACRIYILFDYLMSEDENGLAQFLEDYDHISREAVNAVLDCAKHVRTDPDELAD
jgi:hypothetical protein